MAARRPAAMRVRAVRSRRWTVVVVWGSKVLCGGGIRGVELVVILAPIVVVGEGVVVLVLARLRGFVVEGARGTC